MSFLTELPEELYAPDAFRDAALTERFSVADARTMMWLSQLAYEERPDKIDRIRAAWGLSPGPRIPGAISTQIAFQDTAAIVAARPTAVVVAFAGTDPLKLANWVTNFHLDLKPDVTHRGFQEAADAIWSDLQQKIEEALAANPGAPLFFTGHSLGGALAVLAAEKAAKQNMAVSAVYTFGMPRVGTADFATRYGALASRTYRLRFGRDVVPGVPTGEQGYQHVGLYLHCVSGRFADVPLSAMQALDEPAILPDLVEEVRSFLSGPAMVQALVNEIREFATHPVANSLRLLVGPKRLLPRLFNPAPPARPDLLGVVLEQLPPPIRDHVPHRYLGAL